jgi:hypothetical protein
MAADALSMIGPQRYLRHQDIVRQLRALAQDMNVNPALRKKAAELIR